MKTKSGRYNMAKIEREYNRLVKILNADELPYIVDRLIWEKKALMIKTAKLVITDYTTSVNNYTGS